MIAPDALVSSVSNSFAKLFRIEPWDGCIRVTTQCLYPSNGLVHVFARVSGNIIIISDDRGGLNEAQSAGIDIDIPDRSLRHLVTPFGTEISKGTVLAKVPIDAAPITIIFVANASRAVAGWLYEHRRTVPRRDFRSSLTDLLRRKFETILIQDVEVAGAFKKHKFANLISLPHGRRLIVDPVMPDPTSINARIVAHLDLRRLEDPLLDQRLIYDDGDRWGSDNLNLLSVGGAAVIPFSRSNEALEKLMEVAA